MPAITRYELQSYPCSYCQAKPGDPCRTRLTGVPTQPHQPRWQATFAGRAGSSEPTRQIVGKLYGDPEPAETFQCQGCGKYITDPVEAQEHKSIHGLVINATDRPREVKVHFIYNAVKGYRPGQPRNLWCSCHARFGDDLDAAQRHLRAAHRIPEWLADLGIRNAIDGYIMQLVIDGMLANDEDPTDRETFVRYRDWLLGGLAQQWIDKLDAS